MQRPFRQFTSDNCSGICPEAFEMMQQTNERGHAASYGADDWTERATKLIQEVFETNCEVHFVYTGTAANAMALASVCRSYHSIISHEIAHIRNDECGAPIFFSDGA